MKHYSYIDPIYGVEILVLIGPPGECNKWALKNREIELDLDNTHLGYCYDLGNVQLVWLIKYDSYTLLHELTHATFNIMDTVGIKINKKNSEPFTYYLEHLQAKFMDVIKPEKIKGKKDK